METDWTEDKVGVRGSGKWRPWARVMLTGDMGESRDNRAGVRAHRKACKWRQKPSAAASSRVEGGAE